jgi:hypothetical protein
LNSFAKKGLKILGGLLLLTSIAAGDQWVVLTKKQAEEAYKLLSHQKRVLFYCEPCGEERGQLVKIKEIKVEPFDIGDGKSDYYDITINGERIDLAYTYIPRGDGKWENVGMKLGYPTVEVSRYVDEKEVLK